jgi:hypothetical protein
LDNEEELAKRMIRIWADCVRRENENRGRSKRGAKLPPKKHFGVGVFLFYFGASLLGSCVAQILFRCFS